MPLTPAQAFKVGFLMYCADKGYSIDEANDLVKYAELRKRANPIWKGLGAGATGMLGMIPGVSQLGIATALGAPILAGAGAGYLGAKFTQSGEDAIEEAKQEEVVGEYERLAEEARRRAKAKRLAQKHDSAVTVMAPE